jgi:hypothetical protein
LALNLGSFQKTGNFDGAQRHAYAERMFKKVRHEAPPGRDVQQRNLSLDQATP